MHRINDVIQLWLGIQGENKSRTIEIDMTDWIVGMPNGSPSIWIKRPGDATPTATGATFDMVTNLLTWKPDEVDTYVAGEGTAEIRMTEGTVIKKTKEIRIAVSPAVTGGGTTLGSDWQSYINEVDRLKSLATAAATAAGASEEAAETAAETATSAASAAEAARDAAQASATAAAGSEETARQKASVANGAAASAQNSKSQAISASEIAQTAQNQAESYRDQASISAANAQGYEYRASSYASQASTYKSQAQSSASSAALSAATANNAATRAETAKNAAETANASAVQAKNEAVTAGDTAVEAKTAAETAATAAAGSATAAAGSATSAAADAETAEDAKDAAVAAKTAAEAARDAALTMIDDTAGAGNTDKTWSADKTTAEVTDLKDALVNTQGVIGDCLEYWSDVNSGASRNTTITRNKNVITYNGKVSNTLYTKLSGDIIASPSTLYNVTTGEIPFINGHSYKMVIAKIGGTFTNGVKNDTTIAIRKSTTPQSTYGENITITDEFTYAETDFVWDVDDAGYISGFTRQSVVYSNYKLMILIVDTTYNKNVNYLVEQTLTADQKKTARNNIEAVSSDDYDSFVQSSTSHDEDNWNAITYWKENKSANSRNVKVTNNNDLFTLNGTTSNSLYIRYSDGLIASPDTLYNVTSGNVPFINGHRYKLRIKKIGGTYTPPTDDNMSIVVRQNTVPQNECYFSMSIGATSTDAEEMEFVWKSEDTEGYVSGFVAGGTVFENFRFIITLTDVTYARSSRYITEYSGVALSGNLRNVYIPFEFAMGVKYGIRIDFLEFTVATTDWKYATSVCADKAGTDETDMIHINTAPEIGSQYYRVLTPSKDQHYLRVRLYTQANTFTHIRITIESEINEVRYKRYEQLYGADDERYLDILTQIKGPSRSGKNALRTPLSLLWFTDIHNDGDNTIQILKFADQYKERIDDVICTGDIVEKYENGMNWWDVIDGHEKVLLTIGNHEVFDNDYQYTHTQTEIYNRYISPYVANWNVQQPSGASASGLNYWYKDYSDYYIRLVSIDCMFWDSNQLTWLTNVLSDARTNGLSVIIATHYPPAHITTFDTTFTSAMRDQADMYVETPEGAMEAVQSFIDNGGDFVCWMCGHTHTDFMGTAIDYPDQIVIILACAMNTNQNYNDTYRNDYINMNTFNLMGIDTSGKVIKIARVGAQYDAYLRKKDTICINYKTKRIL